MTKTANNAKFNVDRDFGGEAQRIKSDAPSEMRIAAANVV